MNQRAGHILRVFSTLWASVPVEEGEEMESVGLISKLGK